MTVCSFCGSRILTSQASVTINVADEHAHEAPRGAFHLRSVDNSGKNCFEHALERFKGVQSKG